MHGNCRYQWGIEDFVDTEMRGQRPLLEFQLELLVFNLEKSIKGIGETLRT